jgi:glycosyltransferase involved in cell wall biosynthesis
MRLALFAPLSPLQTAIADHVEGLLPDLAKLMHVDLFIDDGYTPSSPAIARDFSTFSYRDFPRLAHQYDAIVYHMGDEPNFHGYIYKTLREHPGIVVLHDLVLHHCIGGLTWARGDVEGYIQEMRYAYGEEGEFAAREIMAGRRLDWMYRYPLMERVLDSSRAVIVHNEYARRQLLQRRPNLRVTTIPQHFFLPEGVSSDQNGQALRQRLGLEGRFVVATFGLLIRDKQLDVALRAFARFRVKHPESVYLLVGPVERDYDLVAVVRRMGLEDSVRLIGWQPPPSFVRHMFVADLALHLRYPHVGGTPYTPFRLMGLGVPTIVTNIEPLAEIPEGCCAKVDVDEHEEEVLLATMEYLADSADGRRQMSEQARRFIQENHLPPRIAGEYQAFIQQVLSRTASAAPGAQTQGSSEDRLIAEVGAILSEWGLQSSEDALLLPIAEAIAGLGAGSGERSVD